MSARLDRCYWASPTAQRYPTLRSAMFISGDDFLRLAMQTYLAASKDLCPPAGERWLLDLDGTWLPYGCAKDLFDGLLHHLGERLCKHAHQTGDFRESSGPEGARGAGAEPLRVAAMDGRASAPGACPPGSAVGPAATGPHAADITIHESPLFAACGLQRLPQVNHRDTLDHAGEKTA